MKKIESLTQKQIDKFPEYVKKWTEIGLSTEPSNRKEAMKCISKCYELGGLKPPKRIIWSDSPFAQLLLIGILDNLENVMVIGNNVTDNIRRNVWDNVWANVSANVRANVVNNVWDNVWTNVRANVWDDVRANVRDNVWDDVRANVRDNVSANVSANVWANVRANVWDDVRANVLNNVSANVSANVWANVLENVRANVWDDVRANVRDSISKASENQEIQKKIKDSMLENNNKTCFGSHDSSWLSFYDFFNKETGLTEETNKLEGLIEIAQHCGWFIPFKDVCFISERNNILNRDDKGRIHSLTEAAISYPDGYSIYAIHGVRVPEYIILRPHEINIDLIKKENNTEIKRIMIDKYGYDKYLKDTNAKLISKEHYGELYKSEIENDESLVIVKVINSTPETDGTFKNYFLRVPPEITSANQAVAWTFGMTKEQYQPSVET